MFNLNRLIILFVAFAFAFYPGVTVATSLHTIQIDGSNDFTADEAIAGGENVQWFVTWDESSVFFGAEIPSPPSEDDFLVIYLDADPGSGPACEIGLTTGLHFSGQQPDLPFSGNLLTIVKLDSSFSDVRIANGGNWESVGTGGLSFASSLQFFELSLSLSTLDDPTDIGFVGAIVHDSSLEGVTFGITPTANGAARFDPDFTDFFGYPIEAGISPNGENTYLNRTLPKTCTVFADGFEDDPCAGVPPLAPSNLQATEVTATTVTLAWTDNSAGSDCAADSFGIFRSDIEIHRTETALTNYTDPTVAPSTTYEYKIRAYRGPWGSAFSNTISVMTDPGG